MKIIIIILLVLIIINITINIKYKLSYELYKNKYTNIPRFSSINGECKKIMRYMGDNALGVSIKGYTIRDECMANNDICQKYNMNECLKQSKCGYCSNDKNKGMCLSATPDGPTDLQYKMCTSSSGSIKKNKFTMGEPDSHIFTNSTNQNDVYTHTLSYPTKSHDYNLLRMV